MINRVKIKGNTANKIKIHKACNPDKLKRFYFSLKN